MYVEKKGFGEKSREENVTLQMPMQDSGVFKNAYLSAVAFRIEKKTTPRGFDGYEK